MMFPLRPPPSVARDSEYDHKHFLWGLGRPDAASAADFGRRLLARGRAMEALVLVDAERGAPIPGSGISPSSAPRRCWRSGGRERPQRFSRGSSPLRPATGSQRLARRDRAMSADSRGQRLHQYRCMNSKIASAAACWPCSLKWLSLAM